MPKHVRNFWIEGQVDGRRGTISGGPIAASGGFRLTIFQRNKGEVMEAVRIYGYPDKNGKLRLNIVADNGQAIEVITER